MSRAALGLTRFRKLFSQRVKLAAVGNRVLTYIYWEG
jgi:hypothetical protein